jgi:hypothetical protein
MYVMKSGERMVLYLGQLQLMGGAFGGWKDSILILQVVREPLATINSLRTIRGPSWNFMHKVDSRIPAGREGSRLEQCTKGWVYWNWRCEAVTQGFFRVEDLDPYNELDAFPKDLNTREGQEVSGFEYGGWTYEDLKKASVYDKIMEMKERYGYGNS